MSEDHHDLIHGEITGEIRGACFELHTRLGDGFLENVYANGMAVLLKHRRLAIRREAAAETTVGLLCNFGVSAEFKRLISTNGHIGLTS